MVRANKKHNTQNAIAVYMIENDNAVTTSGDITSLTFYLLTAPKWIDFDWDDTTRAVTDTAQP